MHDLVLDRCLVKSDISVAKRFVSGRSWTASRSIAMRRFELTYFLDSRVRIDRSCNLIEFFLPLCQIVVLLQNASSVEVWGLLGSVSLFAYRFLGLRSDVYIDMDGGPW